VTSLATQNIHVAPSFCDRSSFFGAHTDLIPLNLQSEIGDEDAQPLHTWTPSIFKIRMYGDHSAIFSIHGLIFPLPPTLAFPCLCLGLGHFFCDFFPHFLWGTCGTENKNEIASFSGQNTEDPGQ
jgi:hypothetical protein